MDRLVRRNVLALSGPRGRGLGRRRRAAARQDRARSRSATARPPSSSRCPASAEAELAEAAQLASLADETPEGRSIVVLAKQYGLREHELAPHEARFVPFTAQTRMSGVDYDGTPPAQGRRRRGHRLGARRGRRRRRPSCGRRSTGSPARAARRWPSPATARCSASSTSRTPSRRAWRQRFDQLRAMGIRTVMVTGDNRLTAAKIAEEAGVDDFLAEATPERKLELIKEQQADGPARRDDRRRHQRRARARPGRRRRGDEHRHPGGARGGQHGRPRLQPDEAHRDRRGRQAAADHPRRADDVLDRQRRRQVLRDPARDLRRHLRRRAATPRARWTRSTS